MKLNRLFFLLSILLNLPLFLALACWVIWFITSADILLFPILYIFIYGLPTLGIGYVGLSFLSAVISWNKKLVVSDKIILGVNIFVSGFFVVTFLWWLITGKRVDF